MRGVEVVCSELHGVVKLRRGQVAEVATEAVVEVEAALGRGAQVPGVTRRCDEPVVVALSDELIPGERQNVDEGNEGPEAACGSGRGSRHGEPGGFSRVGRLGQGDGLLGGERAVRRDQKVLQCGNHAGQCAGRGGDRPSPLAYGR